jgi:membrane protease YdiL (CAAX protease family)
MKMAESQRSYEQTGAYRDTAETGVSGWAVGFVVFAAAMMIILGTFHAIAGLSAILNDDFYVVREGYDLKFDVTTWGWIQFVGGIVVVLAGAFLLTGNILARITAMAIAVVSLVWSFFSIPYYPVWSIVMIALGIGVIWGVAKVGNFMGEGETTM